MWLWRIANFPERQELGGGSLLSDSSQEELEANARSPVWREIMTCKLLGGASGSDPEHAAAACERWLAAVEAAGVKNPGDADRLGWIAYLAGNYAAAVKWLKLVAHPTYLSCWLEAKLELRAGHRASALAAMRRCLQILPDHEFRRVDDSGLNPVTTGQTAAGEKALLALACGNFRESIQAFLLGNCWLDAAWVAEQLMTTRELKAFVDEQPWDTQTEERALKFEAGRLWSESPLLINGLFGTDLTRFPESRIPEWFYTHRLRWLLARRLMREDRGESALAYYPKWLRAEARNYLASMEKGRNPKLDRGVRARAWWDAAWLARTQGLELMGTEREPDNAVTAGDYDAPPIRKQRLSGKSESGDDLTLPATRQEKERLQSIPQPHTRRWHYRITAADHAWRAARLLPDHSDELQDVLRSALRWLQRVDGGDQVYRRLASALEVRCGKSSGATPWSGPLLAQLEAKRREETAALEQRRNAFFDKEGEEWAGKMRAEDTGGTGGGNP